MPKKSGVLYGKVKENKEFPTVISTTAEQSGKISRPIASGHTEAPLPMVISKIPAKKNRNHSKSLLQCIAAGFL